jgi:glyoxylase-like metal-dependent hydrolase (beta-lactamase superfamily II)
MSIPLEDTVADIIGKAQRGLGLSDGDLAAKVGVDEAGLEAVKKVSGVDFAQVDKLAKALGLGPRALVAIAEGKYTPTVTLPKTGFFQSNTVYGDMTVNSYLVWDTETGLAAAFDTGADCSPLVDELQKRNLTLQDVYLTHTHVDHVIELDRLIEKAGGAIGVHVNEAEPLDKAASFRPGVTFSLGKLHIESRDTAGHSAGGTKSDYKTALKKIAENILSAQDGTILAPGHGPLTTVVQEKTSNPFFPGFRRPEAQNI